MLQDVLKVAYNSLSFLELILSVLTSGIDLFIKRSSETKKI